MTVAERILAALRLGPRDDDELASLVGVRRQHVNQVARQLEAQGQIVRGPGPTGKIVNWLPESSSLEPAARIEPALPRCQGMEHRG